MNVKQGDLAICIKCRCIENVGSIVLVAEAVPSKPLDDGPMWLVETPRATYGIDLSTGISYPVPAGAKVRMPDAWLRPVSGLPDTDEVDTSQPIAKEAV
jgi:hypothetical protein